MNTRQTISAVIIAYNEEKNIKACLESLVNVVDEIILVHDGKCNDQTLTIAEEFTDKIFTRSHVGIAQPHQPFAYERVSSDWILQIDADERLSPELQNEIQTLVQDDKVDAYEFLWPLTNGKKFVKYGLYASGHKMFLVRKSRCFMIGMPEDAIRSYGNVIKSNLKIIHEPGYNNYTWKKFKTKWISWAKIHARYLLKDFFEIQQFQVQTNNWPKEYIRLTKTPISVGFLDGFKTFLHAILHGSWLGGWTGIRITIYMSIYRIVLGQAIKKAKQN